MERASGGDENTMTQTVRSRTDTAQATSYIQQLKTFQSHSKTSKDFDLVASLTARARSLEVKVYFQQRS
jgi:hypothetical protein